MKSYEELLKPQVITDPVMAESKFFELCEPVHGIPTGMISQVLITEAMYHGRILELGKVVSTDYADKIPHLLSVLKGGAYPLVDLSRALSIPHTVEFAEVSSYGDEKTSSGKVVIKKKIKEIEGKHVILVEDIWDTGGTLYKLKNLILDQQPASLQIFALCSKPDRHRPEISIEIKYIGFEIPDFYVTGLGMDTMQFFRNLPFLCVFKDEMDTVFKKWKEPST